MISAAYLTEWSQLCPWSSSAQVEQDLVLSRALVEIYSDPVLAQELLFRGGTALHKVVLKPAARYSEDLDFVQIQAGPIGDILSRLNARLQPWLGEAKRDISSRGATLTYRFASEVPPVVRLKLKIEINTREHVRLEPLQQTSFTVTSRWFNGQATLPIYATTELLGTKLRALYQRRKGRDLFDLWHTHSTQGIDAEGVVRVFQHYMRQEDNSVTASDFHANLDAKMTHAGFLTDTPPLLRSGIHYDPAQAHAWVNESLLSRLP